MTVLDVAGWIIATPMMLLFGVFLTETTLGLAKAAPLSASASRDDPIRTIVLMPAHNEAGSIAQTVAELLPLLSATTRLLVVADNCSDDTASRARAAGAEVIERSDPSRRGKGYALAFGRDFLKADPPDCVIVLDADCQLSAQSADSLALIATATGRPVQASNLIAPDRSASPLVQISSFAFLVKNSVRQRGIARLGAPAILNGTGMAFPWSVFAAAPLASGNIVEDLALGVALTRDGHAPLYTEEAFVRSPAAAERDTLSQRTRWEHGFMATARAFGLPLLLAGIRTARPGLVWLGLHLIVPPLALLFIAGGASVAVLCVLVMLGAGSAVLLGLSALIAASLVVVFVAWQRFGRETMTAAALLRLPLYVLWKIPVYLKFLTGPQSEWTRTRRATERDGN